MRRSILRLAIAAAVLAVALSPHSSQPQSTPDEVAARTLLATNLAEAMINPPKGEDTNFFIRAGGVPNIFFLIDSSGSMERLPPDGPAFYGGTNPTMPPGALLTSPGNNAAQTAAFANRTIVGCGLDAVSSADGTFTQNAMITHIQARKFYPPCGQAHDQALVGDYYKGHPGLVAGGVDYAYEASVCPYYTPSNSQAVWPDNQGGYDPDFYDPSPNNSQIPSVLWAANLVFHDNTLLQDDYSRTTQAFKHNFGKGWESSSPPTAYPVKASSSSYATIDQFCDDQGTTALANGQVPSTVCKQCLKQAGWYYDGVILQNAQDGSGVVKQYPSIWYTGNYLSFFPPKFLIMRKIVKDIIATQSKVRMAMADFGSSGMSFLKEFNPTCAHPDSSFDSNRSAYVSQLNSIAFSGGTPLSVALFDTGRYYHSPGLPWFGSSWAKPTGGSQTWYSSSNSNDYAICYSCQTSSVIVLTDGFPNPNDGSNLPPLAASLADSNSGKYGGDTGTGILDVNTTDCPGCAAFTGTDDYKNNLTRVSWYLHNYDLRDNNESTKDCLKNGGKQTLDVYTVGYATRQLADANTVLANAASAGGGIFVAAENPQLLKEGLLSVFEEINSRSTSFSVATVSTLQTTTGHSVIVPRFDPAKSPFWKGHLYRYELYSEFVNECDPSQPKPGCCSAGGTGDLDCDGKCESVFLQDAGNDPDHSPFFVQEGGDGFFYRNTPNTASCNQAPMCVAQGKSCGDVGNTPATPWWDAGTGLAQKGWKDRKVFTVVDSGARDGRIDGNDAPVLLDSGNDGAAKAILPYLGNSENRVCSLVANRIETAGDAVTASVVRSNDTECAKTVIRWILGADVFNEAARKSTDSPPWPPLPTDTSRPATVGDANAVPPVAPNLPIEENLPDRPFKLGDVFHSSPVEVVAPLPRTGILCPLGLHNQCLQSLWRAPTGDASSDDDAEYDAYVTSYKGRRKIVLAGSNDGLFHAFNGGAWHDLQDDPLTTGLDESLSPFNGYYDRGNPDTAGGIWAEELWAFVPPDVIAKLALVFGGEHQLLVDGTAMVRDVWVDGTANGKGPSASAVNDRKERQEFHTVAVVGERRGGTHYFALDVTDATKLSSESGFELPKFLWMYPQPDDAETLSFGETYTDFLPVAPPIGPVRIKADAQSGSPMADTPVHEGVPFHERWIAFLSGGFDPQYVHGRGVHMVGVWSGKEYFDFSYPSDSTSASVAADDPRRQLRYPIPATMGMVMWGPQSRRENGLGYANAGFFDTATFGDTGGQLWVLRFHEPGVLGTDGKATNWLGARAFQMGMDGTNTDPSLGYAHPFFYITANTALPDGYIYRAYLGTGDRFNLLDTGGGTCGPDNIRACAMRGCSVNVELPSNYASSPDLGKWSGSQAEVSKGTLATGSSFGTGGASVEVRAKIAVSGCPSPASSGGAASFTKDVTVTCSLDSQGRWGCGSPVGSYADTIALSDTSNAPVTHNWYYSIRVFDDPPQARIPFTTAAEARAYDAARLWIRDTGTSITSSPYAGGNFTIMAASVANPPAPVDPKSSAGWAIYYDHGPTAVADGHTYTVNALDERTSSVSGLYGWVSWNTTQPSTGTVTSTTGNCFASKCTAEDRRVAYHYAAHPLTGGTVLHDDSGAPIRAQVGNTLVPAQGDQPTVFINQKGQVLVGLTVVNPEKGAGSTPVGGAADAVTDLGWLEVPEVLHACRHAETMPDQNVCR